MVIIMILHSAALDQKAQSKCIHGGHRLVIEMEVIDLYMQVYLPCNQSLISSAALQEKDGSNDVLKGHAVGNHTQT